MIPVNLFAAHTTNECSRLKNVETVSMYCKLKLSLVTCWCLSALGCFAQPTLISKGPYIQAAAADTFVVMWESGTNLTGRVHYGIGKRLDQTASISSPRKMVGISRPSTNSTSSGRSRSRSDGTNSVSRTNIFYIYEAALPKLKPGKTYAYKVEFGGEETPMHQFRTLNPKASTAQFIAYGDSRSVPDIHAKLAARFKQHNPDFVLHTGDLVARGKDYALWSREFFKPMANVIDEVPFFSVIGNHEEDGTNYLAYFHLPGKELWYSFDDGPVHFVALDYHFESSTNEQFRFAQQDLMNNRAPWKIVFLHYPVFNIGGHAAGWGHTNYLPLFHSANVDMVLGGHSHLYERFRPVVPPKGQTGSVITCVTTGGGGAELHTSFEHPALVARETTNHYIFFEASRDTLKARAMRADGTLIDQFELKKSRGRLPAAYVAQAYPENALKLVAPIAASLETRAREIPNTNSPTEITLAMKRPKGLQQPVTVQLTLAPESAQYYALENGPLTVATPTQGTTNTVVAQVRATGKKRISADRNRDLYPPLIFRAYVKDGDAETVAYTTRARLPRSRGQTQSQSSDTTTAGK